MPLAHRQANLYPPPPGVSLMIGFVRALLGIALSTSGVAASAKPVRVLFIGNSLTTGETVGVRGLSVRQFQPGSVTDLNGTRVGGVPALVKAFADQAGLSFDVSLETVSGIGLDYHYKKKLPLITQKWDKVILQSLSTLAYKKYGDPTSVIANTKLLAKIFHDQNADVDIYLTATWSRADLTYKKPSPWLGLPVDAMRKTIQQGYEQAAAQSAHVSGVIPVGLAWQRAFELGTADMNPYDGVSSNQINLWAPDGYHASVAGYYLEALVIFGRITGVSPRSLGPKERAAASLNITPKQAIALQRAADDALRSQAVAPSK